MTPALLPHVELTTGANPKGTVIWLHGLGADGWDFVPVVRELQFPEETPLRFIFPHAPERPVTINNGYVMPAWYDITMSDIGREPDERGIRESQRQIEAFIEREVSRGMETDKIVLAGFSQGGAITLQTGLRYTKPLAGLLVLSSYLPLGQTLRAEASLSNARTPIFMAHGSDDPVVPFALAEQSRRTLVDHGYRVEFQRYPMPHSLCPEEIGAIDEWLQARYSSPILLAR